MKFAFSLFDDDDNGIVCLRDLNIFSMQFAGVCESTLM